MHLFDTTGRDPEVTDGRIAKDRWPRSLTSGWYRFGFAPEDLMDDRELAMQAVASTGHALQLRGNYYCYNNIIRSTMATMKARPLCVLCCSLYEYSGNGPTAACWALGVHVTLCWSLVCVGGVCGCVRTPSQVISEYCIKSFVKLTSDILRFGAVAGYSSHVLDTSLVELMDDDRCPLVLPAIDDHIQMELDYLTAVNPAIWQIIADSLGGEARGLRSDAIGATLAGAGYIQWRFMHARDLP